MMKRFYTIVVGIGVSVSAVADVVLPKVIDSRMVLQRGVGAPVWGWADQGEEVIVSYAGQVKKALPDAAGKWKVTLDPLEASVEPRGMSIKGKNEIQLRDVLVGEVWLAAGQSNMEWSTKQIAPEEQAFVNEKKGNPLVRAFHVTQHLSSGVPLDDTIGVWKVGTELVDYGQSVSAVGFFFALKLQEELGVPVAFIDANWGGQRIECFIPDEGYKTVGLTYRKHPVNENPAAMARQLKDMAGSIQAAIAAAENGRKIPYVEHRVYGWSENFIYNAMIAPVAPYAIKGAIWYQGESNRGSVDYFDKLRALSAGWSQVFNVKDLPVYQVQIAPYAYNRANPDEAMLCDRIWTAQYRGAQEIPGMGVVAIHDTNIDVGNIHPVHKRTVGERLAAQALNNQYGKKRVTTGPSFSEATLEGAAVVVSFKDLGQGLTTTDGEAPSWFELSADGAIFVKADAVIAGNTVKVSAPTLAAPKFVRMGWKEIALPNLSDKNGWPVFSFPAQAVAVPVP